MKYIVSIFVFALSLVFAAFDRTYLAIELSGVLLICFSFFGGSYAVLISGLCGIFCDLFAGSSPFYTVLYLYISAGCVWAGRRLFRVPLFAVWGAAGIFCIAAAGITHTPQTLANAFAAPVFYWVFKKVYK